MMAKQPRVIVVGAGIVGASIAYHLTCQNADVTLIDKAHKPAKNATKKSFAWITAGYDMPETYLNLRQQAIADWHRVENDLNGQLKIDWSGALTWFEDTVKTDRIARRLINSGHQVRLVDQQEIHLLEPNLKDVSAQAMFAKNEGAIDPVLTTELFVKAAREEGADIQLGNEVLSFTINSSSITGVVTPHGNLTADVVVLAAGANTTSLCRALGLTLPINISPAILMSFKTDHQFVNRIVSNPFMEIRAISHKLLLAAEDYIDESIENNPQAIAQRTLKKIKKHWRGAGQIKLADVQVGRRPIPQGGLPIIGRTTQFDGLYLSVMHSGVTLAAIIGRIVAAEILNGQDDNCLNLYRPERFN